MSDNLNIFGSKISIILLLVFVIFVYIIMFSILHKNNESSSGWVLVIEIVLWITLIIIIVVNIKWLNDKNFNFNVELNHLFDEKLTELNIFAMDQGEDEKNENKKNENKKNENKKDISNCELPQDNGEVFHIESNIYSYDEAKGVCSLFNSRLATYDEVEKAYQNGANWCSYGWSDDQLALFPIQKSLYNELKTIPGHENDCGRPGVNGGFIEDKSTTFGINCYGNKPYMTDKDKDFMKNYTNTPTISPEEQDNLNKKIQDILVAPFNKNNWNYK